MIFKSSCIQWRFPQIPKMGTWFMKPKYSMKISRRYNNWIKEGVIWETDCCDNIKTKGGVGFPHILKLNKRWRCFENGHIWWTLPGILKLNKWGRVLWIINIRWRFCHWCWNWTKEGIVFKAFQVNGDIFNFQTDLKISLWYWIKEVMFLKQMRNYLERLYQIETEQKEEDCLMEIYYCFYRELYDRYLPEVLNSVFCEIWLFGYLIYFTQVLKLSKRWRGLWTRTVWLINNEKSVTE